MRLYCPVSVPISQYNSRNLPTYKRIKNRTGLFTENIVSLAAFYLAVYMQILKNKIDYRISEMSLVYMQTFCNTVRSFS